MSNLPVPLTTFHAGGRNHPATFNHRGEWLPSYPTILKWRARRRLSGQGHSTDSRSNVYAAFESAAA